MRLAFLSELGVVLKSADAVCERDGCVCVWFIVVCSILV